ncbi:MAG: PAS domain S-box protein [Candidatus Lokiarchaeota archaeon]|nr:PAS domain S-box protein [Candidatus Lokiarchaeota archaeon]MBD3338954.1 PAS domain S-box protein [Candidatus Lokiarchaeota archaeon]
MSKLNNKSDKNSENIYKAIFENSQTAMCLIEEDTIISLVNKRFEELSGYKKEEIEGILGWKDFTLEEDIGKLTEYHQKRRESSSLAPRTYETHFKDKTGAVRDVLIMIDMIKNTKSSIATVLDITERKNAERELRQHQKLLNNILSASSVGIAHAQGRKIKWANEAMEKLFGFKNKREYLGKDTKILYASEAEYRRLGNLIYEMGSSGNIIESDVRLKRIDNGEIFCGHVKVNVLDPKKFRKGIIVSILDITDRKKKEEELIKASKIIQESEQRFKSFIDSSPDIVFLKDNNFEHILVNDAYRKFVGKVNKSSIIGKSDYEILPKSLAEQCRKSDILALEMDNTIIAEEKGEDGRIYESRKFPVLLSENKKGIGGIIRDITERKKVEEREDFLYSLLIHDIKNKTGSIRGYFYMLNELANSEKTKNLISNGMKVIEEEESIIRKVGTLREIKKEQLKIIELPKVISSVISVYDTPALRKKINIQYDRNHYCVKAGDLLESLISNLIENSIKHSNCRVIKIQAKETGKKIQLTIEDDGIGINDEDKNRLFERGFKKGKSAGSGLGMYLVQEIARNYSGRVEVKDSTLGGARFDIYLLKG